MNAVLARLRRRLSFANVTAATALFVALGGTSYAAINLPENSVGTREIRTGGVGKSEIQTGGVGSAEIHTGAVRKAEIKTGGVGAAEIHTDAVRSKEIKDGSVKPEELATDSVTGDKIAKDAVTTDEIKDGTVGMTDLDSATQSAIAAPLRASVNSNGAVTAGKATVGKTGTGAYNVDFGTDISKCTAVASLAQVAGGTAPDAGVVTIETGAAKTAVAVKTFDTAGAAPKDEPFDIVVAC